ncbi:MAG: hypothetical protein ACREBE_16355 [bacterium]
MSSGNCATPTESDQMERTRRESPYAACIRVAPAMRLDIDPRHVEAYMRLEHSTLNGLPIWQFNDEVKVAVECVLVGGVADAEALAQSFGL